MRHVYPKKRGLIFSPAVATMLRTIFLFIAFLPLLVQAQAPHITSFHPAAAGQGDTVTISGTHLDSVIAVSFGGVSATSFTVFSDSVIQAIVGSGASGKVKVATAHASDTLGGFTYILSSPPSIPHITSFIPDSARRNDTVLIRGVRFTGVMAVSFGGVAAHTFHVISDSAVWAVVGTGASGRVKVSTTQASDSLGGFIFIAADTTTPPPPPPPPVAPHILSFAPDSARQNDTVRIFGTHLDSVTSVRFGGVPAKAFYILSDSLIRAVVGTGASGQVKVTTTQASDSLGGFIFIAADTTTPPPPPPPASFILINFIGAPVNNHALLIWNVLHEQSIFFYSVEHSTDTVNSHFGSIGGFASRKLDSTTYGLTDTASRTGVNYYRLRIIDTVGNTTLSRTIAIELSGAPSILSLYPNPAISHLTVTVPVTTSSSKFVLADPAGHMVLSMPVSAGVQQVVIPVARLNKGVYKLMWTNGQSTATRTVLILK